MKQKALGVMKAPLTPRRVVKQSSERESICVGESLPGLKMAKRVYTVHGQGLS